MLGQLALRYPGWGLGPPLVTWNSLQTRQMPSNTLATKMLRSCFLRPSWDHVVMVAGASTPLQLHICWTRLVCDLFAHAHFWESLLCCSAGPSGCACGRRPHTRSQPLPVRLGRRDMVGGVPSNDIGVPDPFGCWYGGLSLYLVTPISKLGDN